MDVFAGFVELDDTITGMLLTRDGDTPVDADDTPTFRVYGEDGFILDGSATTLETGNVTGATNASPIVITSVAHGLTNGTLVTLTGVGGNTAANTTAVVANKTDDTFELAGTTGNGAYTTGGEWHVAGGYAWGVDATTANGFAAGKNYSVLFNFAISATDIGAQQTFQVA